MALTPRRALRIRGIESSAAALAVALVVSGCGMLPDDIWPSLTGEEPEPPRRVVVVGPSAAEQATPTISPAARRVCQGAARLALEGLRRRPWVGNFARASRPILTSRP